MAIIGLCSQDCGTLAFIFATSLLLNGDNALALHGWVLFFVVLLWLMNGCVYGLKFKKNMGLL